MSRASEIEEKNAKMAKASSTHPVLRSTAQHSLTFQAYSCACSSWWSFVAPSVGKAVVSDLSNADPKSLCVQSALYLKGKSSKHEGYLRQPAVVFRCLRENCFAVHLDRYGTSTANHHISSNFSTRSGHINANFLFRWPFKTALSFG